MNAHPSNKRAPIAWLLGFLFLYILLVLPPIFSQSLTNDEPIEITNGYFYWQGDVVSHNRHPPFSEWLQALPLRLLPLNAQVDPPGPDHLARAYQFLFLLNPDHFEWMTRLARCVTLLMGLGLGCLLFFTARRSSRPLTLMAMTLWVFEPNLQAMAGLAVADIPVAFFFLAAVLAFQKHLDQPGFKWAAASGILCGMAVTCKFSALVLIPIFFILEWLKSLEGKKPWKALASRAADWAWGAAAFSAWISAVYLPGTLLLANHLAPWHYFLRGLGDMMEYSNAHHPSYFMGHAGRQDHWLYYPAAFLLKSAVPFLILVFLGLFWGVRGKMAFPAWVWVPALLGFADIIPVQNLGIRYLLPIYPFLILIAAFAAEKIWKEKIRSGKNIGKILVLGLGLWQAASILTTTSGMISYFNDFIPADKKIYYLADSNLDWGQDVKRLTETGGKQAWGKIKLAQCFGIQPSLYGLDWEPWTENDLKGPQPGRVYAVNLSFLQLAPVFYPQLIPIATSWIYHTQPSGKIGDTWIYFKVPGVPKPDTSRILPSVQTLRNHAPQAEED